VNVTRDDTRPEVCIVCPAAQMSRKGREPAYNCCPHGVATRGAHHAAEGAADDGWSSLTEMCFSCRIPRAVRGSANLGLTMRVDDRERGARHTKLHECRLAPATLSGETAGQLSGIKFSPNGAR